MKLFFKWLSFNKPIVLVSTRNEHCGFRNLFGLRKSFSFLLRAFVGRAEQLLTLKGINPSGFFFSFFRYYLSLQHRMVVLPVLLLYQQVSLCRPDIEVCLSLGFLILFYSKRLFIWSANFPFPKSKYLQNTP